MAGKGNGQPAYVEELDDTGEVIGDRRTAKKEEVKKDRPSNERRSSRKENGKSSAKDSRRANTTSSSGSSPPVKRVELRQPSSRDERRKSVSSTSPKKSSYRPPSVHQNATFPQPMALPIRSQPLIIQQPQMRALAQQTPRPSSYHEGSPYTSYAPPLSSSAFAHGFVPAPSYPPSSPGGNLLTYGNGATYYSNGGNSIPPAFRQDYFHPIPQPPTRTLAERFGGTALKTRRRSSVYSTGDNDERGYESSNERMMPRKSSLRKTKEQIDTELMPPPSPRRRRSVRYAEDELVDDERYASPSRPVYRDERSPPRQRRPSTNRNSATYTYGSSADARIELERSNRRKSYYIPSHPNYDIPAPVEYEDKFQAAEKYQNSVGGPQVRLTAESLKKASRRPQPTSSHSTHSSGSHDESERQRSSVTTRTTGTNRTGAGEEDITIKLRGQGKIKIAGAEIDYDKDTELNIRRGGNVGGGGSQRSSDYGASDERKDRRERASDRSRMSSNMRTSRERYYSGGPMF